jgi:RND superfamily putative drug exporter
MFTGLGRFVAARARLILAVSGVAVVLFAVLGLSVFGRLLNNGFDDPKSGAERVQSLLIKDYGGSPNIIFLLHARHGTVNSPAVAASGAALTARLSRDSRFSQVTSYWQTHLPALKSRDNAYGLILGTVKGNDERAQKTGKRILHDYANVDTPSTTVQIGGALGTDVGSQVGKDIARAESVAVPLTVILLMVAFGSMVAALLPLSVGVVAIFGALAWLNVMTHIADVSIFAINLVTAMGLGLGIDYALLMVSRFREELASGASVDDAVVTTTATAGRTIAFSALTVAAAMAAMLVFPVYFLKSFAYGGIGVTVFAALGALFVLPALLAILGPRVNAGRVPGVKPGRTPEAPLWGRLAGQVMRRPAITALPVVGALLVLAVPVLHITFSPPDERVLPKSAPSHQVGDVLRTDFTTQPNAIEIVVTRAVSARTLAHYAGRISRLQGVQFVDTSVGGYLAGHRTSALEPAASLAARDTQRLRVFSGLPSTSDAAQRLVKAIRAAQPPPGATVYVGGWTAQIIDSKHSIGARLWLAGLLIVLTSFVLLFLFTGSVLQPLRALLGNALTMASTFGVMVWIFQDGHLASLLGFTPTPTDTDMPVLLFCVAFGLSMDYEVFLISRIKELHDQGAPNASAVVTGLGRTGRIVSTAAALLAVSFFAFGTSHVSFIQFFGLGSGLAIIIDATLVRGVLVPAFQRVFGEASWYAPPTLRRLHDRFGLREPTAASVARPAAAGAR